ncbi:MAC/Perforin domain-containing protein [Actinidia rufa]|uniref:MAC/Perforin domain-containing protein n=1 Tax=Actinidia rufa TaxID=165716 RepID=A0A7J0DU57_9ERIC|nr:MAC/Perforin domain-containing protein [Actinidia rufa]
MAKRFNENSGISGRIPLGSFNAMFNFTGSWQLDAAVTKSLAMIGHVIPLYEVKLVKSNLLLNEEVKRAVPYSWDPALLARFKFWGLIPICFCSTILSLLGIVSLKIKLVSLKIEVTVIPLLVCHGGPLGRWHALTWPECGCGERERRAQLGEGGSRKNPCAYMEEPFYRVAEPWGTKCPMPRGGGSFHLVRQPGGFSPVPYACVRSWWLYHWSCGWGCCIVGSTEFPVFSFIETYGTHIVTSATIGGRDVVYIRQHQSSPLSAADIENYVKDIGDQRFSDLKSQSTAPLKYKDKDVTVIFRRRGGDDLERSHGKWAETVQIAPDVINMTFTPIVSLLEEVPGIKYLARAIDLYLEYKPPIEDLQYFLDFQIARAWAPEQSNIQRKEPVCPSLQFSMMGPKLYISPDQVAVGRKPVTGLRISLEGIKKNRLTIHLQHLVSLPKILQPHWDTHVAIGAPKWQGPEEQDSRWFEPIKWKKFSHVSTSPIEHTETCIGDLSGVHIVTGAQLGVWDFGPKSVLHLKLLFSKVPGCTIRRSVWDHSPSNASTTDEKRGDSSSQTSKLAKIVDMTEMSKGPQDVPGHWLVTGAKLGVDKGKIMLRVKYSLLNY